MLWTCHVRFFLMRFHSKFQSNTRKITRFFAHGMILDHRMGETNFAPMRRSANSSGSTGTLGSASSAPAHAHQQHGHAATATTGSQQQHGGGGGSGSTKGSPHPRGSSDGGEGSQHSASGSTGRRTPSSTATVERVVLPPHMHHGHHVHHHHPGTMHAHSLSQGGLVGAGGMGGPMPLHHTHSLPSSASVMHGVAGGSCAGPGGSNGHGGLPPGALPMPPLGSIPLIDLYGYPPRSEVPDVPDGMGFPGIVGGVFGEGTPPQSGSDQDIQVSSSLHPSYFTGST